MEQQLSDDQSDYEKRYRIQTMAIGYQVSLGGFGVRGRFQYHKLTESDGLRLAPPEPGDALGHFGRCACGEVFYLGDRLQSWLSKAIKAARSTFTRSSAIGPDRSPYVGACHSQPLEFNLACEKCGTTLAVVLQGSYFTNDPVVAVTISLSMPPRTIHYTS